MEKIVETKIDAVTVYPNQALVTRKKQFSLSF